MEHTNDCFTLGPMSRYVEDLEVALSVISGRDHKDWQAEMPSYRSRVDHVQIETLRVGYYTGDGTTTATPDIVAGINLVIQKLTEANVTSITNLGHLPLLKEGQPLLARLIAKDGCPGAMHLLSLEPEISGSVAPLVDLCPALKIETREAVDALHLEVSRFRSRFHQVFADYDLLIGPVNLQPAPLPEVTHSGASVALFSYTIALNVAQIPAVVIGPVLLAQEAEFAGLPIGVQLAFSPHKEDIGFAVGRYLQSVIPSTSFAPQFHSHPHVHDDGQAHVHPHLHNDEHHHDHNEEHAHKHAHNDGSSHEHSHDHSGDHQHEHGTPSIEIIH